MVLALLVLSAGPTSGCGYRVAAGVRLRGGALQVEVRPFRNRSSDPAVGAQLTTALREELARRGVGPGGGRAAIDGEVRVEGAGATLAGGVTARVILEATARLTVDGAVVVERTIRRGADHLGGVDALEGEARRAQALQRLAEQLARELVDAFAE
jgi:uncharacterized lipoprotein YmbA